MSVMVLGSVAGCQTTPQKVSEDSFRWEESGEGMLDLFACDRRVLRYMHGYDPSTPETRHETYKCYHHVFDATGENLLTKGSGGLYTHHRGIFIGWNRLVEGDNEYDFWHMKGVIQRHDETLELSADESSAKQVVRINWHLGDGRPVIAEHRQIIVHETDNPTLLLLDFESQLTAVRNDVNLNGDPEHAGFQYRPHNDVADGIDPHVDKDLPWATMSYGLNGRRYWVQHMSHPSNPTGTLYSAYRDYGRFGAFPVVNLSAGEPMTLRYRILVVDGEMPTREECERNYRRYMRIADHIASVTQYPNNCGSQRLRAGM